jgi:hypothetical protein
LNKNIQARILIMQHYSEIVAEKTKLPPFVAPAAKLSVPAPAAAAA